MNREKLIADALRAIADSLDAPPKDKRPKSERIRQRKWLNHLRWQGRYVAYLKQLKPAAAARARKTYKTDGVRAAALLAKSLR